ncbi:MAG: hypothetical protein AAF623_20615 [Planctomycetota bacterium]
MWRTILLGKLTVSILASIVVGVVCCYQTDSEAGLVDSFRWYGLGAFFIFLAILQVIAIYLMLRRKSSKPKHL